MKKFNIKYLISLLVLIPLLISCEKESEGLSFLTNYVIITPEGGDVLISTGGTFTDPGFTAFEGEKDVASTVTVSDDIDATTPGFYTVSYAATNADGYSSAATRTVIVQSTADYANSLDGAYHSTVLRNGALAYEDLNFTILNNVIECAAGGYYSVGRNYGPNYACAGGTITINDVDANDFSVTTAQFPVWKNKIEVTDLKVDQVAGVITWDGVADFGSTFSVTLTRIK